jgi:hypothetical protein
MATCRICGHTDYWKPDEWENWECEQCFLDVVYESAGQLSPEEKTLCGVDHAWPNLLGHKEIR